MESRQFLLASDLLDICLNKYLYIMAVLDHLPSFAQPNMSYIDGGAEMYMLGKFIPLLGGQIMYKLSKTCLYVRALKPVRVAAIFFAFFPSLKQ